MATHLHAQSFVGFGVGQLDDASPSEPMQHEFGGVQAETFQTTVDPPVEVTPLNGSPAIPGGDLEDGSLGLDVVVTHGPRQVLESSDWTKQRIFSGG